MSRKRPRSTSPTPSPSSTPGSPHLFRSTPIEDRSSRFIGIYSPTESAKTLQALPELKSATHRIAAWCKPAAQRTLFETQASKWAFDTGYDDDGEAYAGKRLEKVLVESRVKGAVVVGRWFGGIMLGPVRFVHIERCAREAIGKWQDGESRAKKVKIDDEDDEVAKKRLITVLRQRDESIAVLRGLLAEKSKGDEGAAGGDKTEVSSSPQRSTTTAPDYAKMTVQVLKRLEQARDRTIKWILEELEKVEGKQEGKGEVVADSGEGARV